MIAAILCFIGYRVLNASLIFDTIHTRKLKIAGTPRKTWGNDFFFENWERKNQGYEEGIAPPKSHHDIAKMGGFTGNYLGLMPIEDTNTLVLESIRD